MQEFKRVNYIIDRRLQFGIISVFLLAVLGASVISAIVLSLYFKFSGIASPDVFLSTFFTPILINDLIIMVIIAVVGVFYSNRIAGPIYHMRHAISEFREGDNERRVRLRPKDYMQGLADDINRLLDEMRK
jgi:signal transduction histidine kinase